jgi:hypothetical protein
MPFRRCSLLAFATAISTALGASVALADGTSEAEQAFEQHIRPLLAKRCYSCHGSEKQQGDLRLDVRDRVLAGDAAVVVPGKPDDSRLVQVVRYSREDTQMPPTGKLPADEIELLTKWVESGAAWPEVKEGSTSARGLPHTADGKIDFRAAAAGHWAFQPIARPASPQVQHGDAVQNPIDRFVIAHLEHSGLTLSPKADRRTLARRAWFDILGVPPTFEEVEAFAADESPDAFERLVDRLLASPLYGQRWGRHWLDVARYADTKGYVFTENRFYPFSFTYRDYVIDSLNADKPYDRFVTEQLAADMLSQREGDETLAALGFLTVGRRFLNNQQDIIDDRIDVVSRGLLGLSVGCARCHDHKFDPIPTADYYSLYGVFASTHEPQDLPLIGQAADLEAGKAYYEELAKREAAVEEFTRNTVNELVDQLRVRAGDYLLAIVKGAKKVPEGVTANYQHGDPRDRLVQQWQRLLERRGGDDPVFRPWKQLWDAPVAEFGDRATALFADGAPPLNRRVREAIQAAAPKSLVDLAIVYGQLFAAVDGEWKEFAKSNGEAKELADVDTEQVRRVLYGEGSVGDVPRDRIERFLERDHRNKLRELKQKIAALNVESAGAPPRAMVLVDNDQPTEPVVFVRGNSGRPGDKVPRRFLQVLEPDGHAFAKGSGRLELAQAITDPENPLTARVIANRVWAWHVGSPLVGSPSDFGFRSDPPTHPELLDYLASFLRENNWSLKALHREILLSATWQQASVDRAEARAIDAENRLYWRMNHRRREFEAQRDAWLTVAGRLDPTFGGRPVNIESQPVSTRRTVYGLVDRNNLPGLLRTFDFPSPDVSAAQRPETTVPQQALFSMNSPFIQEMARDLAARTQGEQDAAARIDLLFQKCYGRNATAEETASLKEVVDAKQLDWTSIAQALLMANELTFVD